MDKSSSHLDLVYCIVTSLTSRYKDAVKMIKENQHQIYHKYLLICRLTDPPLPWFISSVYLQYGMPYIKDRLE